jgi:hypothetical protein
LVGVNSNQRHVGALPSTSAARRATDGNSSIGVVVEVRVLVTGRLVVATVVVDIAVFVVLLAVVVIVDLVVVPVTVLGAEVDLLSIVGAVEFMVAMAVAAVSRQGFVEFMVEVRELDDVAVVVAVLVDVAVVGAVRVEDVATVVITVDGVVSKGSSVMRRARSPAAAAESSGIVSQIIPNLWTGSESCHMPSSIWQSHGSWDCSALELAPMPMRLPAAARWTPTREPSSHSQRCGSLFQCAPSQMVLFGQVCDKFPAAMAASTAACNSRCSVSVLGMGGPL